ncbi:MAG: AsmA-like C-terminal domain-containing protein [Planctomycetia bacterium]|nr:AsmA-like C-terminal domain-containing protein [Planctomycetia bacterium]
MQQTLKYIKWFLLLAVLTVAVVAGSLYRRIDHELLRYVRGQLDRKYPNAIVTIEQASFNGSQGIRLRGVRIATRTERPFSLLESEEVYIECPISLRNYLNDDLNPSHIIVKYPTLYLPQTADTTQLKPLLSALKPVKSEKKPAPVDFRDAKIALVSLDDWRNQAPSKPAPAASLCPGIQLTALPPGFKSNEAGDVANPDSWYFQASITNHSLKEARFSGLCTPNFSDWNVSGAVHELELGPETAPFLLFAPCPKSFLDDFAGATSFSFQVRKDLEQPTGIQTRLQGELFRGFLAKNQMGHPLSDIYIKYAINNSEIQLERITGRSDSVLLLADYQQSGFQPNAPACLHLQLNNVPLDNGLVREYQRFLPEKVAGFLDQYDFSCQGTVNLGITRQSEKWAPDYLSISGTELRLLAKKFPYLLEDLTGTLILTGTDRLELHLQGTNPNRPLSVDGLYTDLTRRAQCETTITASGYAIDEPLLAALPPSCREELASMRPRGLLDATISLVKKDENDAADAASPAASQAQNAEPTADPPSHLKTEITLTVHDASCCYEKFPYRITGVQGEIRLRNGIWSFDQLRGKCSSAEVHATGILANDPLDGDPRFSLRLSAQGLPVDEELYYALSNFPQYELVKKLNARGKVDANVRIDLRTKTKQLDLEFEARPIPEVSSIRPEIFPYELRNLQGLIVYRKGEMVIENLRGANGLMVSSGTVRCRFHPDGSWQVDVSPLIIDQFRLDHEFQNAVPTSILKVTDQINLNGYFNLSGHLCAKKEVDKPIETVWDMGLVLQQIESRLQIPVENICGRARVYGQYIEGQPVRLRGELDLDSLCSRNIQVTGLTGPFYYDGRNIFFGATSPHPSELVMFQNDFLRRAGEQHGINFMPGSETSPEAISPAGFVATAPDVALDTKSEGGNRKIVAPASASGAATRPRQALKATTFDGPLWASGYFAVDTVPSYQVSFLLRDASMPQISRDLNQGQPVPGKATVFANLQGEGRNLATLKGDGGIVVKETALYDQPQILKLFQLLSVNEPDKAAFNSSSIDFRVFGKQLRLEHITLTGPMLSLFGSGWMTLEEHDRLLDLTFNSRLGNSDTQIPIVSDVLGGAGDQISQIRVEGPMSDPVIRVERFPGIRKAWWSVFPGTTPKEPAKQ